MSHKIVVIEDSIEVCESIASILKLGRYNVLTANNEDKASSLFNKIIPT
ncbi:MAG: hypothetical protein WDO15_20515 [Bacteroidota bacterium]